MKCNNNNNWNARCCCRPTNLLNYGGRRRRRWWKGRIFVEWNWCRWRNLGIPGQHNRTAGPWRMMMLLAEMTRRLGRRRRRCCGCSGGGGRVLVLSEIVLKADDQSGVTASACRAQRDSWNKIDETGSRMSDSISWRQFFVTAIARGCSSSAVISRSGFLSTTSGWFLPRQMRFHPRFELTAQHFLSLLSSSFPCYLPFNSFLRKETGRKKKNDLILYIFFSNKRERKLDENFPPPRHLSTWSHLDRSKSQIASIPNILLKKKLFSSSSIFLAGWRSNLQTSAVWVTCIFSSSSCPFMVELCFIRHNRIGGPFLTAGPCARFISQLEGRRWGVGDYMHKVHSEWLYLVLT